ncbi:hypothetical protein PSHT_12685 [Puccinia striiformis]|uniref:Uncharacterized protein n=1 Tax=Puccinia striiformis TaxID=27350 RepID=A0A2S4UV39_9BASI|nr:hypothetical protein PSHT_12685 [Puccinia striiformis]
MDTDDFFFTDEANNGDHAERPAGEVPLATLAEGSNRRRTTAKIELSSDELIKMERRKDAFSQRLKEATDKHPDANEQEIKHIRKSVIEQLKRCLVPVTFRGAHFAASSAVSIHVKKEMEADLAKHGFHRFTFDWNAPFVHDVLWNSVWLTLRSGTGSLDHQSRVDQGEGSVHPAEVATEGTRTVLRSTKRKIATLRGDTFKDLYPARKILGHLLRDPDAVSDSEEDDANTLPRRRSPTAEEQKDKPVPARFPRDAYDTDYLLEEGEFQAEHLTTEAMDIEDLGKAFGAGYRSPAIMAPRDLRRLNRPARLPAMRRGRLAPRCKCQDEARRKAYAQQLKFESLMYGNENF